MADILMAPPKSGAGNVASEFDEARRNATDAEIRPSKEKAGPEVGGAGFLNTGNVVLSNENMPLSQEELNRQRAREFFGDDSNPVPDVADQPEIAADPNSAPKARPRFVAPKKGANLDYTFTMRPDHSLATELKHCRFIVWAYIRRENGSYEKKPFDPKSDHRDLKGASTLNPETWGSLDQAMKLAKKLGQGYGVGVIVRPEDGFVYYDLDCAINYDTEACDDPYSPLLRQFMATGCYVEESPGRTGARVIAFGSSPNLKRSDVGIEVFGRSGFVTLTGEKIDGSFGGDDEMAAQIARDTIELADLRAAKAKAEAKAKLEAEKAANAPPAPAGEPLAQSREGDPWQRLNAHLIDDIPRWWDQLFDDTWESGGKLRARPAQRWVRPGVTAILTEEISATLPGGFDPVGIVDWGVTNLENGEKATLFNGDEDKGGRRPLDLFAEFGVTGSTFENQTSGWVRRAAFLAACEAIGADPNEFGFTTGKADPSRFLDDESEAKAEAPASESGVVADPKPARKRRFKLTTVAELLRMPPARALISGLYTEGGMTVLAGAPRSGKSVAALGQALAIGYGQPDWCGRAIDNPSGGGAIYIAAEGQKGYPNRVRAGLKALGLAEDAPGRFKMILTAVNMMAPDEVTELIGLLRDEAEWPVSMVVFDTLSRAMPGADENSQAVMSTFVEQCDRVREALNCMGLPIHHTGNNGQVRGSSVLRGGADVLIWKRTGKQLCEIHAWKLKDMEDDWREFYALRKIELEEGQSALVAEVAPAEEKSEASEPARALKPLKGDAQMLYATFLGLVGASADGKVLDTELQQAFAAAKPNLKPSDAKNRYRVLRKTIHEAGHLVFTTRNGIAACQRPTGVAGSLDPAEAEA